MKKFPTRNFILLMLWLPLMIWIVGRTPPHTMAEEKLKTMVSDLDFMFKNGAVLSRYENAKTGAALALYKVDASTWDEKKVVMLKDYLAAKGWTSMEENSHMYVMCKNEMKASISRKVDHIFVNGSEKTAYLVSMEFNAGTKDYCG
ncbi:hypothetical protein [Burkholderia sp. WSM2230]|uniref:hypothetical protein n=1 Tax=Burkholderia sp. WSM2230 TaxID=944435 RepID=UPI0012EB2635|nr:hypothetical protein [Burkholderia sp. WSM2230]